MKNIWLIIILCLFSIKGFTQVNFEHSYLLRDEWFLTNLGDNDYKYVVFNRDSSRFSIYNLDHSPYLQNIQIPFAVNDQPNNVYYQLGYITKSLFDCDSSNIEYAIMLNRPTLNKFPNTAIYRTDGTVIFSKDSVGTMFCVGCGSGSYEVHPIMNTPVGTKMYLFTPDSINNLHVLVYSLCGSLPEEITEIHQSNSFISVYPNPSTNKVIFDVTLPSSYEKYELTIFNSNFQTIKTETVSGIKAQIELENQTLSSGSYYYSLQSKNKVFQTGKFLLTK